MSHLNASLLSVKHDHDQSKLDLSYAKGYLINHDDDPAVIEVKADRNDPQTHKVIFDQDNLVFIVSA